MLIDHEMELTPDGGTAVVDDAYGSKPHDLKATTLRDVGIGEPVTAFMQILGADFGALTSIDVSVVTDTDGAGASEVSIVTKNFLLAACTVALGVRRIGVFPPGLSYKRYLTAKWVVNGANVTGGGKLKVWLMVGLETARANQASSI